MTHIISLNKRAFASVNTLQTALKQAVPSLTQAQRTELTNELLRHSIPDNAHIVSITLPERFDPRS